MSLERRLTESNSEREILALQSVELRASKHTYKGKLEKMESITQEHVSHLASNIILKSDEIFHLQGKLKDVKEDTMTEIQQVVIQIIDRMEEDFSLSVAVNAQEVEDCRAELQSHREKAEIEMGEKLSLKELLKTVTADQKNKEEKLEILANEKFSVEDQLAREKNHLAALAQNLDSKEEELTHAKQHCDTLAAELQDAYERLDTAIADTANLSDEVMAKTVQVKQYHKRTESYKAKVEEANSKLQQIQQELQRTQQELQRLQELVKIMKDDRQYQVQCQVLMHLLLIVVTHQQIVVLRMINAVQQSDISITQDVVRAISISLRKCMIRDLSQKELFYPGS